MFSLKIAFFRITQGHADRTAQKATLLEEAKVHRTVYNLSDFTKHMFFKINAFFRMSYRRTNRTAQKATLLEKAKIDFSLYNLANFTKHVFSKQKKTYSKSRKYNARLIYGAKTRPFLRRPNPICHYTILTFVITFLLPKWRDPFHQLRRFWTLQSSREGLYGLRIT